MRGPCKHRRCKRGSGSAPFGTLVVYRVSAFRGDDRLDVYLHAEANGCYRASDAGAVDFGINVNAALGLAKAAPAAGARVLAGKHARGAGDTADRRVSLRDQGMLGQAMLFGMGLEVRDRPVDERVDLDAVTVGLEDRER